MAFHSLSYDCRLMYWIFTILYPVFEKVRVLISWTRLDPKTPPVLHVDAIILI